MRIMCAIDFSEGAREAARVAAELSRERAVPLVLVHVEETSLWLGEPPMHLPGDLRHEQLVRLRDELENAIGV